MKNINSLVQHYTLLQIEALRDLIVILPFRGHFREPFCEQTPLTTTNLEVQGRSGLSLQGGLYPSSLAFPQLIGPAQQAPRTGSDCE
ncbi:hypothetical protein O181_132777 [Austropuccinia psidii MF-1]|uniref:Uncharacterized protein n=1 Tax=Austropuccinia psidii MF-1 TaxID=1389203 RepID=A0A9Q3QE25_9BASI|nr:hypothetical protein [Austropuccinia psidii MF-1]